jgi:hypothetical protein
MNNPIFAPVVALVAWSMIMAVWMVVARIKGFKGIDPALLSAPGLRSVDIEAHVPGAAKWPGHNYNHLMEQPTVFYAVAIILALAGGGGGTDMYLAWGYVILRVVHSLVQATFNNVSVRGPIWMLSTVVLILLTYRAAMLVF